MISINRVRELLKRKREPFDQYADEYESGIILGRNDMINQMLIELDKEEAAKSKVSKSRFDDIDEEHF